MKEEGMSAFILPSTDPHMSEYVSSRWKSREWISGFNGSAGTIVVTEEKAGLWTDSRYFLQATAQLEGTGIDLYKLKISGTPSIEEFLSEVLPPQSIVGIDGTLFSVNETERLKTALAGKGVTINASKDPIEAIRTDRPPVPQDPARVYAEEYAGRSCREKVSDIRRRLSESGSESILLSALDEIAWTLNLRGTDVRCTPVVVSYLLITGDEIIFFISSEKMTEQTTAYLKEQGVVCKEYGDADKFLGQLSVSSVSIDPDKVNYTIYSSINPACRVIRGASPVALLKAIRNETELDGLRNAMKKDGIAFVKFQMWLESNILSGTETELSIDRKLTGFRAEQELFEGPSFTSIIGYKEHAAIVHYSATPETDATLQPKGFVLIDSGGQYLDGTTDMTRTIALGELTDEEKLYFTIALKGNIALSMAKFPAGTRGSQIDILARKAMWERGLNYLHGTGHGVGHFLSVHEGPQSVRMEENPVTLVPGMVLSNEPALYKDGSHGVRTENMMVVARYMDGMYGEYYMFETVTLCPICKKGIIKELLNKEEIEWFNNYHRQVYAALSPALNKEEREWLKEATKEI